mgnify:CR=1 FL=1
MEKGGNSHMKKLLATLLVLMLVLCASFASAEGLTIGYSTKTITNDAFQLSLHDAIKAAVEANGDTFVSVIAESQTAVATQVSQIEDLINQGVDGLLVNPMDSNLHPGAGKGQGSRHPRGSGGPRY